MSNSAVIHLHDCRDITQALLALNPSEPDYNRAPFLLIMGIQLFRTMNVDLAAFPTAQTQMMYHPVIQLQPATTAETHLALEEVRDFATTDMGRGGPQKWTYHILKEPELTQELARVASATSKGRADIVSFQPCSSFESRSQDRAIVEEWNIAGRKWTFTAVLDGHVNHATVDFAAHALPVAVRKSLQSAAAKTADLHHDIVSRLLSDAIASVDKSITSEFLRIFPGGESTARNLDNAAASSLINDNTTGGYRYTCASRVLGGSTALLTLFDERNGRLWVANLGDSCAVLGHFGNGGWTGELVNAIHSGESSAERQRVQSEHAGEAECMVDNRIIGWLQPTRALGDAWLKMPAIYTEKVLIHMNAPWFSNDTMARYTRRIKTPPYVSHCADVYYRQLRRHTDAFLITCSDGLPDLSDVDRGLQALVTNWARVIGRTLESLPHNNLAMSLLRDAIGGSDTNLVSRNLTVEMEERWMDDTTIIVQRFV